MKVYEKYGVRTLIELDRVIHKIHERIIKTVEESEIKSTGDGLVITGLAKAFGHQVISSGGWVEAAASYNDGILDGFG